MAHVDKTIMAEAKVEDSRGLTEKPTSTTGERDAQEEAIGTCSKDASGGASEGAELSSDYRSWMETRSQYVTAAELAIVQAEVELGQESESQVHWHWSQLQSIDADNVEATYADDVDATDAGNVDATDAGNVDATDADNVEAGSSELHWSQLLQSTEADNVEAESSDSELHRSRLLQSTKADDVEAGSVQGNWEVFRRLQEQYPGFFKEERWELGEKIAEGVQAEIFILRVLDPEDADKWNKRSVGKVMKARLEDLQKQWPLSMLRKGSEYGYYMPEETTLCIWGGQLTKDGRFMFVMERCWGDLRTLIDLRMQHNGIQAPPFTYEKAFGIMYDIARGMRGLHTDNIIHRDLKASNVLIWPDILFHKEAFGDDFDPLSDEKFTCKVADFECSIGVVGTSFWRAPEILHAARNQHLQEIKFSEPADVYSYAITCYEILTGNIPFQDLKKSRDAYSYVIDAVIEGARPTLPNQTHPQFQSLLNQCWNHDPSMRPSFHEIVYFFESMKKSKMYMELEVRSMKDVLDQPEVGLSMEDVSDQPEVGLSMEDVPYQRVGMSLVDVREREAVSMAGASAAIMAGPGPPEMSLSEVSVDVMEHQLKVLSMVDVQKQWSSFESLDLDRNLNRRDDHVYVRQEQEDNVYVRQEQEENVYGRQEHVIPERVFNVRQEEEDEGEDEDEINVYVKQEEEDKTYSSPSTSLNNSFSDILHHELQQIDNIYEVHSDYEDLQSLFQNGDNITIFCCYDATNVHFEFYFKNSQEMASVVGAGMQYAKVVLVDGWKTTIQELSEIVWKQTFERIRSNSTIVYKSLKLLQNQGNVTMTKECERYPLLYIVAKYFTLKEALTELIMTCNNDASTSKESSERVTQASDAGKDDILLRALRKLILERQRKKTDEDEDKDGDDTNNSRNSTYPEEINDKNSQSIVSIELLAGGEVVKAIGKTFDKNKKEVIQKRHTKYQLESKGKFKVLEKRIKPDLELLFLNQEGIKQIQCTVGTISFNMDGDGYWLHDKWRVIFGLHGVNQQYAKVARRSIIPLGVKDGKMTWNESVESGRSEELAIESSSSLGANVRVLPVTVTTNLALKAKNAKIGNDTRGTSFGGESSTPTTTGGLSLKNIDDPTDNVLEYQYFNPEGPYNFVDFHKAHASHNNQDVKFQGKFTILENSADFVEYKLIASRYLKEVEQESIPAVLEKNAPGLSEMRPAEDEVLEITYKQKYEKTILINHSMTHLDGKRHKLKEAMQGSKTIFTKENSDKEYEWPLPNAPLVKPSPSTISGTSASDTRNNFG